MPIPFSWAAAMLGLSLFATSPALAGDTIADSLKTSNCAPFAKAFIGPSPSVIIRVMPILKVGLPDDRFAIVMTDSLGLPVVTANGSFWAYSPPQELQDKNARDIYNIFGRSGTWLVLKKPNGAITAKTKLEADVFINAPANPAYPNNPKCYRMGAFGIMEANLPPMDYATE